MPENLMHMLTFTLYKSDSRIAHTQRSMLQQHQVYMAMHEIMMLPVMASSLGNSLHSMLQGMMSHREVASRAGGPGVQDSAQGLHILACRPNGEDHCRAQGRVRTVYIDREVWRALSVVDTPSLCPELSTQVS